jgi:hypothetical protein
MTADNFPIYVEQPFREKMTEKTEWGRKEWGEAKENGREWNTGRNNE